MLDKYKITYTKQGVTQFKHLISHDDYINDIKPSYDEIDVLETAKKDKEANKKLASDIKKRLKKTYTDNWFTDKSPLFYAIENGVLSLPTHQGGDVVCEIIKV